MLAHEFGHFTQGTGLRLTYLVRAINYWFVRVVYERDGWDQWLEETANDWDVRVGWILRISQLCVYLSRGILWLFMVVGHAASGFMLRQIEFTPTRTRPGWSGRRGSSRPRGGWHGCAWPTRPRCATWAN